MYINPGYIAGIIRLEPQGTNSTFFTACCETAICNDEPNCPRCHRPVVGYDADNAHERGRVRWRSATRHWRRNTKGFYAVALITLALVLGGCSQTIATYKDGVATVKRNRFLMTEDIGSFSYDATDGSFTLDGYKSDMTQALILINRLIAEKEETRRKLAALGGKP